MVVWWCGGGTRVMVCGCASVMVMPVRREK